MGRLEEAHFDLVLGNTLRDDAGYRGAMRRLRQADPWTRFVHDSGAGLYPNAAAE